MSEHEYEFDVFISHASEDKAELVRPLADLLQKLGLRVWLDEQALEIGDSLFQAIEAGLRRSRFGIVVISPSFFSKKWTDYELRGFKSREMFSGDGKVILPIWFKVSVEDVLAHSVTLAERVALKYPEKSLFEISMAVLKVVNPERAKNVTRYILYRQKVANAKPTKKAMNELKRGPIRHAQLPRELVVRIRLVHLALGDAAPLSLEDTIDNYRRDVDPEREAAVWERIAVAFLEITNEYDLGKDARMNLVRELIRTSLMTQEELMAEVDSEDVGRRFIVRAYVGAGLELESEGDAEDEAPVDGDG